MVLEPEENMKDGDSSSTYAECRRVNSPDVYPF